MNRLICFLLALSTFRTLSAGVVGMISASPENRIAIETVKKEGRAYFTIKRWGRNCPIQFALGHPFSSDWRVTGKDGKKYIVLSLFDGPPQTDECPNAEADKPGISTYSLEKFFSNKLLSDAHDDFFERGASLALIFQEFPPGKFDAQLATATFKLADIEEKTKTVYEIPWKVAR